MTVWIGLVEATKEEAKEEATEEEEEEAKEEGSDRIYLLANEKLFRSLHPSMLQNRRTSTRRYRPCTLRCLYSRFLKWPLNLQQ
jgi:hypothetical protein